ncbi:hypothetical protein H311_05055, partial [Anncaliia algerae PRA109]
LDIRTKSREVILCQNSIWKKFFCFEILHTNLDIPFVCVDILKIIAQRFSNEGIFSDQSYSKYSIIDIYGLLNRGSSLNHISICELLFILCNYCSKYENYLIEIELSKKILKMLKEKDYTSVSKYLFYLPTSLTNNQRHALKYLYTLMNKMTRTE